MFNHLKMAPLILSLLGVTALSAFGAPSESVSITNSMTFPRLTIHSSSCEALDPEVDAMLRLKLRLNGSRPERPSCKCDSVECSVVLDSILPESMNREIDLNPAYNGPNCFNTSLRTTGLLEMNPRVSSQAEIRGWLDSPLCRHLRPDEENKTGDLIVVSFSNGDEFHGFNYISDSIAYSKGGYHRDVKFLFMTVDKVYLDSKVPAECRRVDARYPLPEACKSSRYAEHFRCETLESYRKKSTVSNPKFAVALEKLSRLEREISEITLFGYRDSNRGVISVPEAVIADLSLRALEIRRSLVEMNIRAEHAFLLSLAIRRVASLDEQIKIFSSDSEN
jgi:hypothetical protein